MPITSRKVFSIYRTLNRDQVRFVLDKVIEGNHTADDWLNRLNRIAFMDLVGDETRSQAGSLSLNFGILTAVTLVLTIFRPVLFFLPLGFLIIFAYFFSLYISLLKIDISNHMRIFLVPLISILKEQISDSTEIYLKMDFSKAVSREKIAESVSATGAKQTGFFRHHWIDGKVILNDGITVEWNIEDEITRRNSKLLDKAEKMKFRDYDIKHLLKMKFLASSEIYTPADQSVIRHNGQLILDLENESVSNSLEQGMEPPVFVKLMEEGIARFKPIPKPS